MIYKTGGGFDYPRFYEYYEKTVASPWRHQEAPLESDKRDWQYGSTQAERNLIAGVLKGFTSMELGVQCYWGDKVTKMFAKPEIQAMARAFSYYETVHAAAYSYLSDELGFNEYEEFMSDPVALKKVSKFFESDIPDKVSLAVFSGAGEGVSLYGSFAILLSFTKDGRYTGLASIISWSCIDEATHSNAGCELFNEWVNEEGLTSEEEEMIYDGFRVVLNNEFSFIDNNFMGAQDGEVPISPASLKGYLKYRANNRLRLMNLQEIFILNDEESKGAKEISEWFDPMIGGPVNLDFFKTAKEGSNYTAKPTQDYMSVNLGQLDLQLV
jgi:ribonucleoside-diphosphate reductase beta chain